MGKRLDPEEAEAIMLEAGLEPLEPYGNKKTKWKSQCMKCKSKTSPTLKSILSGQGGCYPCGRVVTANKRRIKPEVVTKALAKLNLKQLEPYIESHKPLKCQCLICKEIVSPSITNILQGKSNCKVCSDRQKGISQRKTEDVVDKLLKNASLLRIGKYESINKPLKCKCLVCGSKVSPRINDIQRGIGGCRNCSKQKISKALTFKEIDAVQTMLLANFEPQEPYFRAKLPWKCKCLSCETIVYPALSAVKVGHGCSYCATFGFQKDKSAYLYLVTHNDLNSHKIGIGNTRPDQSSLDRLHKLTIKKWMIYKKWNFTLGAHASSVEKEVFRILRQEHGIKPFLDKKKMPITGGHTETIDAALITLVELEKIIKRVIKDYSNIH
jgi:hypothetical protein